MKSEKNFCFFGFIVITIASTFFLVSCGKKGAPTFKTFEKPLPVTDIKVKHREDELIITWSYPRAEKEGIKGFYIEKAEVKGQEFENIAFLKNDISRFTDKDFKAGKQYLYKIRVYSLRDVISDDSPVIRAMPQELPPPPTGLSYKVTNDAVEITWKAGVEGVGFNIYKGYEKDKRPASLINAVPLKEPFFKDGVETGKPVYYTVITLLDTEIKDEGYPSEILEVNPDAFIPSKPFGIRYVPSAGKVYLMWNENPEAWVKGYRIYRKRSSEAEFKQIGEAVAPAFTDNEPLTSRTTYYITSVGPVKESIPSDTAEVHPLVDR